MYDSKSPVERLDLKMLFSSIFGLLSLLTSATLGVVDVQNCLNWYLEAYICYQTFERMLSFPEYCWSSEFQFDIFYSVYQTFVVSEVSSFAILIFYACNFEDLLYRLANYNMGV